MTPLYSWPVPGRNPGTSTNDTIGILKASQKDVYKRQLLVEVGHGRYEPAVVHLVGIVLGLSLIHI